ncbi:MAG: sensor histidine kinase [Clostridia bacterium]
MSTPPTLRSKLLRSVLVPVSLIVVADVVASSFLMGAISDRIYDRELAEIGRELALHVRRDADGISFDLSPEAERTLLLDEVDKVYYAVRDGRGAVVAGEAGLPQLASAGGAARFADDSFRGERVRLAALPVSGAPSGTVVEIAETMGKRHELARELLLGFALPQVVLIVLGGVLVSIGIARGLSPLERLRAAVAARSHTDMGRIEASDAPGEVQPLVAAVNDLIDRFGAVLDFQTRFIADTAHQLRTPVAGLKAHIEVALRESSLAKVHEALAHLYTSADRMSRLVSQLLSLARNEPNTARRVNFDEVDFNQLALETTKDWVTEAYKKNIDLGFDGPERPVFVYGDPARLTELINNLVDNAIRYTPQGGRVTVRVRGDEHAELVVNDDGPRIPVEERERVFERFHRLLGTHAEGSGLGLAIVREIATLHGAQIRLEEDRDGVGNTFTVTFPPAAAHNPQSLQPGNPAASLR